MFVELPDTILEKHVQPFFELLYANVRTDRQISMTKLIGHFSNFLAPNAPKITEECQQILMHQAFFFFPLTHFYSLKFHRSTLVAKQHDTKTSLLTHYIHWSCQISLASNFITCQAQGSNVTFSGLDFPPTHEI
jgi:hypothetical protein